MKGGKRQGAGRPQGSKGLKPARSAYLHIRVTQSEKAQAGKQAESAGVDLSAYVRRLVEADGEVKSMTENAADNASPLDLLVSHILRGV
jgi:hypothetical protein